MGKKRYEFLIIGGGILGSAAAFSLSKNLKEKNKPVSIALLDLDLEGEFSSTLKNAGGVRATWRNDANIQLCSYSIKFFETIGKYIDLKQLGYYWLHNEKTWEEINKNHNKYLNYGVDIVLHDTKSINKHLPFVDNLEGVNGLSISKNAGLIDHYSLREYYRRISRENEVDFFDRQFVVGAERSRNILNSVKTKDVSQVVKEHGQHGISLMLMGDQHFEDFDNLFECEILINTCGAWTPEISKHYGFIDNDIKPRRRQVELVRCPDIDLSTYGMVIDTSDVYFHKEGDMILVGYSNLDEPYGVNFKFDFYSLDEESPFIELIWKPLWNRITKFEKLKFIRGWAGIYAETPDKSGYLGKVPGLENVFECTGHTGRGLMISYGAGEALADLVLDGKIRDELSHAGDFDRKRPRGHLYEQLHL